MENYGFDVRIAWRRGDPRMAADAIDFWTRNDLLPPGADPAERAEELTGVAYKDKRVVAVATATLTRIDELRARFAVLRASTDPEFRRSHAQRAMGVPIREAVRTWSLAHPEERVAGRIAFMERGQWGGLDRLPVWPMTRLSLAGYDQNDRQVRVDWFDHFRLEGPGGEGAPPPFPPAPPPAPEGIELRPVWQLGDKGFGAEAIAFWRRLGNLPGDVNPEARAKEAVVAAYQDGRMIGISTVELGILPQVRERLAMLRASMDPEFRRTHVGVAMGRAARDALEAWSAANPAERLAGLGGIVESSDLAIAQRAPWWEWMRMGLVGFTPDGRQIRVSWFEDFRLD
jgi:hypothetical protein